MRARDLRLAGQRAKPAARRRGRAPFLHEIPSVQRAAPKRGVLQQPLARLARRRSGIGPPIIPFAEVSRAALLDCEDLSLDCVDCNVSGSGFCAPADAKREWERKTEGMPSETAKILLMAHLVHGLLGTKIEERGKSPASGTSRREPRCAEQLGVRA